jgi:uncharacterized protein YvpB
MTKKHLLRGLGLFLILSLVLGFLYFVTRSPQVVSPPPLIDQTLNIGPLKPLVIRFNKPLSRLVVPSITPPVPGRWRPRLPWLPFIFPELVFTPQTDLAPDTEYVVTLERILPLGWVNLSQSDRYLFIFKTPATPATVLRETKTPNPTSLPTISVSSAQVLTPAPSPTGSTFSLKVPQSKQHYTFTCFTVAAKMALAYRGVTVDELGFLDEIGYDLTPRNFTTNTWGDPNVGVVGAYDGAKTGGYGAHWGPVSKAMEKYRRVEVKRQWNISDLLKAVKNGNPVMVWWVNGVWPAKDISWNNAVGQKVYTVNGMHVEVVRGFTGTPDNPEYILTNDPWRGERRYTPEAFTKLWTWFDNTAVVVY